MKINKCEMNACTVASVQPSAVLKSTEQKASAISFKVFPNKLPKMHTRIDEESFNEWVHGV